ncbi:MAG: DUF5309 family protein [Phycisphaeraceae bacterium]|nr:DUF5309 family protein [Phycisphaeraceae bacterium]
MSDNAKVTYLAGSDIPEVMEDVSDLVSIISPLETPLLAHLGDSGRFATSTIHEWLEESLIPNTDTINQASFTPNAQDATGITVNTGQRFKPGDQVRPGNAPEVLLVTAVAGNVLTVVRRYGGTPASNLANGQKLTILGNAAVEGADAPPVRLSTRFRQYNYTQIFTTTVEVSGTLQAVRKHGVADELDYQKQERLRELLRDLENCVINGTASQTSPQGAPGARRTMNGIIRSISANQFVPGQGGFPSGGGAGADLNETLINTALRGVWENASSRIDTIVCGGMQKRRINQFIASNSRHYNPADRRVSDLVSIYESDFGVCRVLLSRWVPADTILLLDSSRIALLPLAGRAFHFKPLAATGDAHAGQLIGEYTLEMRCQAAHALIRGLSVS